MSWGIWTPPIISFLPSTNLWTSYPIPTLIKLHILVSSRDAQGLVLCYGLGHNKIFGSSDFNIVIVSHYHLHRITFLLHQGAVIRSQNPFGNGVFITFLQEVDLEALGSLSCPKECSVWSVVDLVVLLDYLDRILKGHSDYT